jgi:hypothetical protein
MSRAGDIAEKKEWMLIPHSKKKYHFLPHTFSPLI